MVSGMGQKRRSQGKKTWMAFLDFRKAFPSVWREGLWEKMKYYGIDGKFLRFCQDLYRDVGARVRVRVVLDRLYFVTITFFSLSHEFSSRARKARVGGKGERDIDGSMLFCR